MFVGRRAHIQVRDALQRVVGMLLKRIPSLLLVPSRQILFLGTRQRIFVGINEQETDGNEIRLAGDNG